MGEDLIPGGDQQRFASREFPALRTAKGPRRYSAQVDWCTSSSDPAYIRDAKLPAKKGREERPKGEKCERKLVWIRQGKKRARPAAPVIGARAVLPVLATLYRVYKHGVVTVKDGSPR
jgi:hypothetical protein